MTHTSINYLCNILALVNTTIYWYFLRQYHPMSSNPTQCKSLTCSIELAGLSMGFFVLMAAMVHQSVSLMFFLIFRSFCSKKEEQKVDEPQEEEDSSSEEESDEDFIPDEESSDDQEDQTMIQHAVRSELRKRNLISKKE